MNPLQRLVVVAVSLGAAALLYATVPRHGAIVDQADPSTRHWDLAAESLSSARAARWLSTHPATGADVYHRWLATLPETTYEVLGPRPLSRRVFEPHPRTHEVVLKNVLPFVLVGVAVFAVAGYRPSGSS
jgi:hypothetical protein